MGYFPIRCLTASYIRIAEATETFSDVISPAIGIAALASARSSIA